VPARHVLEVADEQGVDEPARHCADDGHGLRGGFLGDNDADLSWQSLGARSADVNSPLPKTLVDAFCHSTKLAAGTRFPKWVRRPAGLIFLAREAGMG